MATQGPQHSPQHSPQPTGWAPDRLAASLAIAHRYARRGARRLRLSRSDRDDMRQDILLALLEREARFEPERAPWDAFATLLARHVVADRIRLRRDGAHAEHVNLDLDGFPAGASATQRDEDDPDLRLDLGRVGADMPASCGRLLALLRGTADIAEAQRQAPESCAAFYRSLSELRCWLHAAGLRPMRGTSARAASPTPP
jgi:DNA-directed RNA polymerase specialized sigma24 family protein